jgi:uncharacterized protein YbjQ (UPF0145 family)
MKTIPKPYLSMYTLHGDRIVIEGKEYRVQALGLMFVHRTEGMGVFRDIFARIKDFLGGNVGSYNSSVYEDLILPSMREMSDRSHETYYSDLHGSPDCIMGFTMNVLPLSSKGMSMMQATLVGTVCKLHEVVAAQHAGCNVSVPPAEVIPSSNVA